MKRPISLWTCCLLFFSCIGEDLVDDYVAPDLRITNAIVSIREGLSYQFEAQFFDESGKKVDDPTLTWSALPPTAVEIHPNGTLKALQQGSVTLFVSTVGLQGLPVEATTSFEISPRVVTEIATATADTSTATTDTSTSTESEGDEDTDDVDTTDDGIEVVPQFYEGQIHTTSGYALSGNFRYEHNGIQIILSLEDNYNASSSLPGLYLYLTNNPNSPEDGYEVGAVTVFSGAHSYTLPASIGLMDYKYLLYWCKPFRVKVGEAQIFEE